MGYYLSAETMAVLFVIYQEYYDAVRHPYAQVSSLMRLFAYSLFFILSFCLAHIYALPSFYFITHLFTQYVCHA